MLTFTHKHYVPILKTKDGERWGLSHLSPATKAHLTPLLEFHAPKQPSKKSGKSPTPLPNHAETICEEIATDWGVDDPFFMDTVWLHGVRGDAAAIGTVFSELRKCGVQAIPVARITYGPAAMSRIRSIVSQDKRGCMLRVTPAQLDDVAEIDATVRALGIPVKAVHLLVDYKHHPMDLGADVPRVPHLSDWLTFTAASGSFPRSFAGFPLGTWQALPRTDWRTWERGVTRAKLARRPAFADYTTRDTGAPAAGGQPSVNLRYTRADDWIMRMGGKVNAGASPEMKRVCHSLVHTRTADYRGPSYSAGDEMIHNIAQPATGTGNVGQWIAWGMSHHMVFTAEQIQAHPAL